MEENTAALTEIHSAHYRQMTITGSQQQPQASQITAITEPLVQLLH